MRIVATIVVFCLALTTGPAFAVKVETFSTKENKNVALVESQSAFPFEFEVEGTYVGDGDVERGEHGDLVIRDFNETQGMIRFVYTPMTKIGILRLGLQTERYSFSFGSLAPIPDNLHSTNLIIGLDTQLSDSILIRLEMQPGFYGTDFDDFGRDTFNVPFLIGGTYIYSSNVQFVFGVGFDAWRQTPLLPGGGVRWKFAPEWTLNAVVPKPRAEQQPAVLRRRRCPIVELSSGKKLRHLARRYLPQSRVDQLRRIANRRGHGLEDFERGEVVGRGRVHPLPELRFSPHGGPLSSGWRGTVRPDRFFRGVLVAASASYAWSPNLEDTKSRTLRGRRSAASLPIKIAPTMGEYRHLVSHRGDSLGGNVGHQQFFPGARGLGNHESRGIDDR
jgi:hypothetical protein